MAPMRGYCMVVTLLVLLSMGLLLVILGQYQAIMRLNAGLEELQLKSKQLDDYYQREDLSKMSMENTLAQRKKAAENLEDTVVKETAEMEKKKVEFDACEAEKNRKSDELAGMQKAHKETEATLKAESEAWNQEVTTLKAQLVGRRPICDYVKKNPAVQTLCSNNTTSHLTKMQG